MSLKSLKLNVDLNEIINKNTQNKKNENIRRSTEDHIFSDIKQNENTSQSVSTTSLTVYP